MAPGDETRVFRSRAADRVLRLLVDAHETEFAIPELADATDASHSTVWRAVDLLDELGVIRVRETPQRKYVSVDSDHLQKPDPVLSIDQSEFHPPVRTFVEEVRATVEKADDVDRLVGILVFGSVARGEADRQSDVDVLVVVEGDRTTARRLVTDVVSDLRDRRFDGDRFDFEQYVESATSARRAAEKLRPIFEEGITVYGTDGLQSIRKAVYADE